MIQQNELDKKTMPQLLDIILRGDGQSDDVMYYILSNRISVALEKKFQAYDTCHVQDFNDVIDDFFIYLREGKKESGVLYSSLYTIRNRDAFEPWLVRTFKNFLLSRNIPQEIVQEIDDEEYLYEDNEIIMPREACIEYAADIIAYTHQKFSPKGQIIFLRSLLTLLDKSLALPDRDIAEALDMSYTLYRVSVHRIFRFVLNSGNFYDSEGMLELDDFHRRMAEDINNDFDLLYPTLIRYYDYTLGNLKEKAAITQLRIDNLKMTGQMCHKNINPGMTISPKDFLDSLVMLMLHESNSQPVIFNKTA